MSQARWELLRTAISLIVVGLILIATSYLIGCATTNQNPLGGPVQEQEPSCHEEMMPEKEL